MHRTSVGVFILGVAVASGACGSSGATSGVDAGPPADAGPGPATALFEIPRGAPPSEFYALPFPNDERVKSDGTIDLSDYPMPSTIIGTYINATASSLGFGVNSAIFFRFSAAIDPTTLPQTPEASLAAGASVYLVNIDPTSTHMGNRIPLQFRFEPTSGFTIGTNWLSCLPYPGFPLDSLTKYAVIVTNRVKATDGSAVGRSADFNLVMATGTSSDTYVAKMQTIFAPLFTVLDSGSGDARADVADATVFTTEDATGFMAKLRDKVNAPCNGATFPDCIPEPTPDGLVRDGQGGGYTTFEGTYQGPNFQSGDLPYEMSGGGILVDADGNPIPQRLETIRWAITIPDGTVPANGWPIALYGAGTGGDYMSFVDDGTGSRLAAQGIATISIDANLNGLRAMGHDPDVSFFNVYNPVAFRDNVRQGALDNWQLLRLALPLTIVDGTRTHTFDSSRVYYFGHSQGSLTGPAFLAYEPSIKGAVLSGAAGLLYIAVQYKTEPVNVTTLVQLAIPDHPLDNYNPVLAMVQMGADVADPVSYGPLLTTSPVEGMAPKDIFQSEGFVDSYAPDLGIEAFATSMSLSLVGPVLQPIEGMNLRNNTTLTAPVMDNMGLHTGVLLQYTMAAGSDGHFVVFEVPAAMKQSADFLGTLAATGTATLVTP